jgi:HAD superfamily hydrolase (TIGR01549 family)
MTKAVRLRAVIWDFDGTLVDSRHKNLSATRTILEQLGSRRPEDIESLSSLDSYERAALRSPNWRELYVREFGLTVEETDQAGHLWEQVQFDDPTPPMFYDGIEEVLAQLSPLPQGVVSQNSALLIDRVLSQGGLRDHFGPIIGYDDVGLEQQKPHPEGLLMSLERMDLFADCKRGDVVLFVGDHEVDVRCAHRAQVWLEEQGRPLSIRSVAAVYGRRADVSGWKVEPHHEAHRTSDVLDLVRSLKKSPGSDW